jgi:hypothetical protein
VAKGLDPHTKDVSAEAREAINAVIDALSEWREEVTTSTERFSETVLDKMATAARAAGWPDDLVKSSRAQLIHMSKMQAQMIDRLMEAWQEQMKSPLPGQFLSDLRPFGSAFQFAPGMEMATAPLEFWMQAAEAWQRNLASAWSMWAGSVQGTQGHRSSRHH